MIILDGDVEVVRVDELLDVNPAQIRAKKLLTDLVSDIKSGKISVPALEAVLIHDNISAKALAQSGETYGHIDDATQNIAGNKLFDNQAHGGNFVQSFSASTTFNTNNGNNQEMIVTAATTIGVSNEVPGTYIFNLEIDSVAAPVITIGASFGDGANTNPPLSTDDNDINVITLVVRPNATKYYTVLIITP